MAHWNYEEIRRALEADLARQRRVSSARERKRRRIVAAATALFVAQGYRKTSVEQIARSAGVAKGTLYLYFKTKADMLMAALDAERRRYATQILPLFQDHIEPRDRLRRYIEDTLMIAGDLPLMSRLQGGDREIQSVLEELDANIRSRAIAAGLDLLVRLIDEAAAPHTLSPRDLEDRASVLMGVLLAGFRAEEIARSGLSRPRFAELLARIIVDGLGGNISPGQSPETVARGAGAR